MKELNSDYTLLFAVTVVTCFNSYYSYKPLLFQNIFLESNLAVLTVTIIKP